MIHNGKLRIRVGNNHQRWTWYESGSLLKNQWLEFVVHIVHSKNSDGLVEVWENKKQIVRHQGANMYPNAIGLPNWKLGLYKWTWEKKPTSIGKRIIYFDNVKIEDQFSSLKDMVSSFVPPKPILASPANMIKHTIIFPYLKWLNRDATVNYIIEISEREDFNYKVINFKNNGECFYKAKGLKESTKYFWKVKALNEFGESDWSETWSFITESKNSSNILIGFYKMEEGRGNVVFDHSGNGNDVFFEFSSKKSPYWMEGKDGLGLGLDPNVNNFGRISNNASMIFESSLTISAWVRPKLKGNRTIISKGNLDGFILRRNEDGRFFFGINTGIGKTPLKLTSKLPYCEDNNTWIHVAVTYNGLNCKIYINGKEENSINQGSGHILNNSKDIQIGATDGNNRWVGDIDEIKIYKKALNPSEIFELYKNLNFSNPNC